MAAISSSLGGSQQRCQISFGLCKHRVHNTRTSCKTLVLKHYDAVERAGKYVQSLRITPSWLDPAAIPRGFLRVAKRDRRRDGCDLARRAVALKFRQGKNISYSFLLSLRIPCPRWATHIAPASVAPGRLAVALGTGYPKHDPSTSQDPGRSSYPVHCRAEVLVSRYLIAAACSALLTDLAVVLCCAP